MCGLNNLNIIFFIKIPFLFQNSQFCCLTNLGSTILKEQLQGDCGGRRIELGDGYEVCDF